MVTNKRISKGKTDSYYLEFPPVGPLQDTTEAEVGLQRYEQMKAGDTVVVAFGQGALGATWYALYWQ